MSWWEDWGPALPVEGGLVVSASLRGSRINGDTRSIGNDIIRRVLERVNRGVATRGRSYARGGQTVTMTIELGRIHATVQGSSNEPYSVTLACHVPPDRRQRLIRVFEHGLTEPADGIPARGTPAIRDEINACALLDGVPITAKCSCPYGAVCKHCVALAYIAADRLDGSPIAVATFLGVRDEDLGVPARANAHAVVEAMPTFDSRRQAQLARTLARLDGREAPTGAGVIAAAAKILPPPPAVLAQLGLDPPDLAS